jgi:hypothetical protein
MAARYTFSVENALPLSRRDCRNINTVSTEHWKGTSSVEVHQSSKTCHLASYTVRVEGTLALWMVIITFCGRPHDVRFILSRAKPREPDVLGGDEKFPPEPGTTDPCAAGVAAVVNKAFALSPPTTVSEANSALPE